MYSRWDLTSFTGFNFAGCNRMKGDGVRSLNRSRSFELKVRF